jgi:hypothetical protein
MMINRFAELIHLHQQRRTVLLDTRHHLVDVAELGLDRLRSPRRRRRRR